MSSYIAIGILKKIPTLLRSIFYQTKDMNLELGLENKVDKKKSFFIVT